MCLSPIIIKNKKFESIKRTKDTKRFIAVPCGHCAECLNKRRNYWSYRLNKECENYPDYLLPFVSLDYAPDFLPWDIETDKPTLNKQHLQKFIKAIRNDNPDIKFKFYAVGEYGETFSRPHYHILFMGLPNYLDFQKYWKLGRVDVGYAEPASIHYVAGYFLLINDFSDHKVKPFSLMSKNIGLSHYEQYKSDYLRYFKNNIPVSVGNCQMSLPKYYKDKLKEEFNLNTDFQSPIPYIQKNDTFIINQNYFNKHSKKPKIITNGHKNI